MDELTPTLTPTEKQLAGVINTWYPEVTNAAADAAREVLAGGITIDQIAEREEAAYRDTYSEPAETKYIGAASLQAYRHGWLYDDAGEHLVELNGGSFEITFDRVSLKEAGLRVVDLVQPDSDQSAAESMLRAIAQMGRT